MHIWSFFTAGGHQCAHPRAAALLLLHGLARLLRRGPAHVRPRGRAGAHLSRYLHMRVLPQGATSLGLDTPFC